MIHRTALIDPTAELGPDVAVGPYAIIGPRVTVGDHTQIAAHAVLERTTRVGRGVKIGYGTVIGNDPQDLKYKGEETWVQIGDGSIIREYCTINRGTTATGKTSIGESIARATGREFVRHRLRARADPPVRAHRHVRLRGGRLAR